MSSVCIYDMYYKGILAGVVYKGVTLCKEILLISEPLKRN